MCFVTKDTIKVTGSHEATQGKRVVDSGGEGQTGMAQAGGKTYAIGELKKAENYFSSLSSRFLKNNYNPRRIIAH